MRIWFLLIFFSLNSRAEIIDYKGTSFDLNVPKSWIVNKNLFGLPVALVSPKTGTSRIVVGVTPTNKPYGYLNKKSLQRDVSRYYSGRRKWVKKYNGKVDRLYPLEFFKDKQGNIVYKVGYKYSMTGTQHEEFTYFANCNGMLFHLKTLRNLANFPNSSNIIDETVRSFNCK